MRGEQISKTPLTDAFIENGFSAIHETETLEDFARKLETDRAELVEALNRVLAGIRERASAMTQSDDRWAEETDRRLWQAHDSSRALLARLEADK